MKLRRNLQKNLPRKNKMYLYSQMKDQYSNYQTYVWYRIGRHHWTVHNYTDIMKRLSNHV